MVFPAKSALRGMRRKADSKNGTAQSRENMVLLIKARRKGGRTYDQNFICMSRQDLLFRIKSLKSP